MKGGESSPIQQTNHQHTSPCDAVWSGQHVLGRETFEDKENKVSSLLLSIHGPFFTFYFSFVFNVFFEAQLKSIVVVWALTPTDAMASRWTCCWRRRPVGGPCWPSWSAACLGPRLGPHRGLCIHRRHHGCMRKGRPVRRSMVSLPLRDASRRLRP